MGETTVEDREKAHTPESILALAGSELARAVYRTANALLASSTDAEEVTLDVLVALHKKLGELGEDGLSGWLEGLPGWLDRAAVSKAKGRAKKRKHHSGRLEELNAMSEQLGRTEGTQMAAALLVKEVLAYLPRRHRFVFVLEYGLGHDEAAIAELTGIEPATVARTLATVQQKLREFAAHHPMPKAMLDGMAVGVEDNPLRHYIEVFGRPDEVAEGRIKRRFDTYLEDDPAQFEMSGDYSFHDQALSGSNYHLDQVLAAQAERETAPDLDPEPDPVQFQDRRRGGWVFAAIAGVAVVVLGYAQLQLIDRLDAIDETLAELGSAPTTEDAGIQGPVVLEPGEFIELQDGSRAEPSKDATVELLRNEADGAEFRLSAGSIGLHVRQADGENAEDASKVVVHDGRYDISATASRFRVAHTGSVPDVEVLEGKVTVVGGLLGGEGVEISSSTYSLANAIRARGEVPIAELSPYAAVDPEDAGDLAVDDVYGRALALRATDEAKAEALLREIVDRGDDDWVSEMAFGQLRTLVAPDQRVALATAYAERFPDGQHAEAYAAILCQAKDDDDAHEGDADADADDAAQSCWTEFDITYPNSLYGP